MCKKETPLTDNLSEFLKLEYERAYKRCYKTFETFEANFKNLSVQCPICKTYRILGNDKRCDCEYEKNLKRISIWTEKANPPS